MVESFGALTTITTIISLIGGGVFYLRYTATRANIDGKNETIATLSQQNDVLKEENGSLKTSIIALENQNKVLAGMATQTPEIVKLTESVTHLTNSVNSQLEVIAKQHKQTVQQQSENTQVLKTLVTAIQGRLES